MIIMQLSKQKTLSVIVNFTIGFFFLSFLSIKNGYNIAPALLIVLGLGYSIYGVIKKWQWSLSKEDNMLIYSYLFYFATFVLSFIVHQGKIRELDNPSRVLLFIPVLLLLLHIPPRLNTVLYAIPLGAMIAGITAIYDKLVLHSKMAFSVRIMHIQGGDIAMSLGMFSVAIGFYFFQKTQLKQTAPLQDYAASLAAFSLPREVAGLVCRSFSSLYYGFIVNIFQNDFFLGYLVF